MTLYFSLFGLLASFAWANAETGRAISSNESGWPQFRGPHRDGVSDETGLLQSWPAGGPDLLWSVSGLGKGYSSPIISNESIYITGDVEDELVIYAYDLDGNLRWKSKNGKAWANPWPGARAACTYDDGLIYNKNAHGRAACFDAVTGAEIWAVDTLERFDALNIEWGLSEGLLIDGNKVIITVGGKKALMAALDKKTGDTVWATGPLRFLRTQVFGGKEVEGPYEDHDNSGYAPPILFETGGRSLIAGTSGRHVFCVDADAGKLVWTKSVPAKFEVIGTIPLFWNDHLFFSAPDDFGGQAFKVHASAESVRFESLWESPVDNCHGALVHVDGSLYLAGYRRTKGWVRMDAETGAIRYLKDDLKKGSTLFADGRLYAQSEGGVLELLKPAEDGFETVGRIPLSEGKRKKNDAWAHPAVLDGRLYLRDHDTMWCYDIKR